MITNKMKERLNETFQEGVEREKKVLKWIDKQVKDLSYELIGEYWEKTQPKKYVEIIKELREEERMAEKWAKSILAVGYEAGEFDLRDDINFEVFSQYLEKLMPTIYGEMEKSAKWFGNQIKRTAPELYDHILANGGDPNRAQYVGNEGNKVWYEVQIAGGYFQILYDPSTQSVLQVSAI